MLYAVVDEYVYKLNYTYHKTDNQSVFSDEKPQNVFY